MHSRTTDALMECVYTQNTHAHTHKCCIQAQPHTHSRNGRKFPQAPNYKHTKSIHPLHTHRATLTVEVSVAGPGPPGSVVYPVQPSVQLHGWGPVSGAVGLSSKGLTHSSDLHQPPRRGLIRGHQHCRYPPTLPLGRLDLESERLPTTGFRNGVG